MIKAYFYLGEASDVPLGETEYWIVAVPRQGETVTVAYYPADKSTGLRHVIGTVLYVQWTFEPSDNNDGPDWCTVDITLRELHPVES